MKERAKPIHKMSDSDLRKQAYQIASAPFEGNFKLLDPDISYQGRSAVTYFLEYQEKVLNDLMEKRASSQAGMKNKWLSRFRAMKAGFVGIKDSIKAKAAVYLSSSQQQEGTGAKTLHSDQKRSSRMGGPGVQSDSKDRSNGTSDAVVSTPPKADTQRGGNDVHGKKPDTRNNGNEVNPDTARRSRGAELKSRVLHPTGRSAQGNNNERRQPVKTRRRSNGLLAGAVLLMGGAALALAACEKGWNPFKDDDTSIAALSSEPSLRDQILRKWNVRYLDYGTPEKVYEANELSLRMKEIKTGHGSAVRIYVAPKNPISWYKKGDTRYEYGVNSQNMREKGVYTFNVGNNRIVARANAKGEFILDPRSKETTGVLVDKKTTVTRGVGKISELALREQMSVSAGFAVPAKDGATDHVAIIATSPDGLKKH